MLPRETCVQGGPLVEEKTSGAFFQVRQGWHLPLGHEPLGQGDVQAIEADSQYLVTRHHGTSLPFTAGSGRQSPRLACASRALRSAGLTPAAARLSIQSFLRFSPHRSTDLDRLTMGGTIAVGDLR